MISKFQLILIFLFLFIIHGARHEAIAISPDDVYTTLPAGTSVVAQMEFRPQYPAMSSGKQFTGLIAFQDGKWVDLLRTQLLTDRPYCVIFSTLPAQIWPEKGSFPLETRSFGTFYDLYRRTHIQTEFLSTITRSMGLHCLAPHSNEKISISGVIKILGPSVKLHIPNLSAQKEPGILVKNEILTHVSNRGVLDLKQTLVVKAHQTELQFQSKSSQSNTTCSLHVRRDFSHDIYDQASLVGVNPRRCIPLGKGNFFQTKAISQQNTPSPMTGYHWDIDESPYFDKFSCWNYSEIPPTLEEMNLALHGEILLVIPDQTAFKRPVHQVVPEAKAVFLEDLELYRK